MMERIDIVTRIEQREQDMKHDTGIQRSITDMHERLDPTGIPLEAIGQFETELIGALLASERDGAEMEMIARLVRAHLIACPLSMKFRGKSVSDTFYRLGFRYLPGYGSKDRWKSAVWWANPKCRTERGRSQKGKYGKRVKTCVKQTVEWLRKLADNIPEILEYPDDQISKASGIAERFITEALEQRRKIKQKRILKDTVAGSDDNRKATSMPLGLSGKL